MTVSKLFSIVVASACTFLAAQCAMAREVAVFGPTQSLALGQTATVTVTDQAFEDQCDGGLGFCASDFMVAYDRTVLQYLGTAYVGPVPLNPVLDLFTAPGAADADPAGLLNVQLVLTSATSAGPSDIFTITFRAIGASSPGGSLVTVSPLADAPSYSFQTASASVSVVPEPSSAWMMSAALIVGLMALRRQR